MEVVGSNQQARTRALIVPREHGAWGLLLVPLLVGAATGLSTSQRVLPTLVFVVATLLLFWLRTPVESLIGSGPMAARTREERRAVLLSAGVLIVASTSCLMGLMWGGRNLGLFPIGAVSAVCFILQAVLRKLGRSLRMASQVVGTLGLTAAAPAAYYVASGRLDMPAFVLWAANWLFAADQIHFVQLRIHASRARTFREKAFAGKFFLAGQVVLLALLATALLAHVVSPFVVLAFVPALFRGTRWFFQAPQSLNVKALGWSEMRQGIAFGVLLTFALLMH